MIKIDLETSAALDRMELLQHRLDEDETDEASNEEYEELLPKMVAEFLPLVERLCKAGLLTCSIGTLGDDEDPEDSAEYIADPYCEISGEPTVVFENGAIYLHSPRVTGASFKKGKGPK